jgi:hypothetical protein
MFRGIVLADVFERMGDVELEVQTTDRGGPCDWRTPGFLSNGSSR